MNKFDKQHILNVRGYQRRIDNIYKKAVEQVSMRSAGLDAPDGYIFTFDDFPALKKQIDALISKMESDIEFTVVDGVRAEWDLANEKNDALVDKLMGDASDLAKYHRTHEDALAAFLERKQGGLSLSENVWKYATQFKDEIEMGLDCGIRDGLDAGSMARRLQQYLQHPDMLFRRVRDEHGVLQLSQRAAAFHPGQGVYRSSYKNARRLAATETNIAYRSSDHARWQDLDFVVGIEVHLSNNHTCLNNKGEAVAFFDICDELQGKYPKDFKFTGWHPHCRCIAVPITKTKEEMDADDERILRGEEPLPPESSENYVKDMPDGWNGWVADNADRIESAKSMPYFIKDNFKDGDVEKGLRWMSGVEPVVEKTPAITFDAINAPRMAYVTDSSKMKYIERVENLLHGIIESDPTKDGYVKLVRSTLSDEAAAKRTWNVMSSWHSPDHLRLLETSKHINELMAADLSAIPEQWRGTMAELIKKINAHDITTNGYHAIYSEVEHAYNIYKLSTTPQAVEYGLAKLSTKTPYNIFTELRKKIPDFGVPEKAFFDKLDKFVPMLTNNKGAYWSPSYGHVNIGIKNADDVMRLKASAWYRGNGLLHHEFTHAFDYQRGLYLKDKALAKIFDDFSAEIAKDNGASIEAKIQAILKDKKDAVNDAWNRSEIKKSFDDAQMKAATWEESRKISKARHKEWQKFYADAMYDLEEQVGAFSDCVGAALKGKRFISPRGHDSKYFKVRGNQLNEFIAHCGENYWSGNPYFKELAPQLYELMVEWYKGL